MKITNWWIRLVLVAHQLVQLCYSDTKCIIWWLKQVTIVTLIPGIALLIETGLHQDGGSTNMFFVAGRSCRAGVKLQSYKLLSPCSNHQITYSFPSFAVISMYFNLSVLKKEMMCKHFRRFCICFLFLPNLLSLEALPAGMAFRLACVHFLHSLLMQSLWRLPACQSWAPGQIG